MGLTVQSMSEGLCFQLITTVVKILIIFAVAINVPPIMVWLERRAPAFMQRRKGPNRVGLFKWRLWGLLQSLADAIKLIFKEESVPASAHKAFFHLGPIFSVFPAFLVLGSIPFGHDLTVWGQKIPLQVINLNVGFLFFLAMTGMAVYGVVLAGWASHNKFSLLGSLRASAQMLSYEIPLGLALIPLVLIYNTLDLNVITHGQSNFLHWGIFLAPFSFIIFVICMFAETNRAPFDLAEGESELVAGFHTEFGSAKFALFFLAEYVSMFALSLLASIFFLGGWQIPFLPYDTLVSIVKEPNIASLIGAVVLLLKGAFFMWLYVWVRWTLPRFRYDQLMKLGWKFLLPLGLVNIVVTAGILALKF
jgi:NADH-quinone oxidoreductase subunit H